MLKNVFWKLDECTVNNFTKCPANLECVSPRKVGGTKLPQFPTLISSRKQCPGRYGALLLLTTTTTNYYCLLSLLLLLLLILQNASYPKFRDICPEMYGTLPNCVLLGSPKRVLLYSQVGCARKTWYLVQYCEYCYSKNILL